eukprot:7376123-Prymnesium_polylepis.1
MAYGASITLLTCTEASPTTPEPSRHRGPLRRLSAPERAWPLRRTVAARGPLASPERAMGRPL